MNVLAAGASTAAGGGLGQQASLSRVPDGVTRPSGGRDAARAAANPSWRLHSFGGIAALVKEDAGVPALTRPTDVLVRN